MGKYWAKRSIELERLVQDKTDATIKRVNKFYDDALKDLDKKIYNILGNFTKDSTLSMDEALKLLNTKRTKEQRDELLRIYNRIDDAELKEQIKKMLEAPAYGYRISKIEALKDMIVAEATLCGWYTEKQLTPRMIDSFEQGYYRNTYSIQKGTGLAYDFNNISSPTIRASISHDWKGSNYSKRIWHNTDLLAETLKKVVTLGMMNGHSMEKMRLNIQKSMGAGRSNASRLIRTEVNYICGQGRKLSYDAAGIEKYIFIATLDLRTSAICQSLDGKIFLRTEAVVGKNFPPMHPNCRSVDGAYIEGRDRSKLKRKARNPITGKTEYVPQDMTYEEWYKKYVKGNTEAEANQKAKKNERKDKEQYDKYKQRLGKKAPKTFEDFQKIKYQNKNNYNALKEAYRKS